MDDRKNSISLHDLGARPGSGAEPIVVDARRDADFAGARTLVADALHRSPVTPSDQIEIVPLP